MESFKDITEKLKELGAKKLTGGEATKDKPKPVEPEQNQNPSTNDKKDDSEKKGESIQKINLAEASRDELIEFIKKQTVHVKKIEVRCVELFDAYKKVKKEKEALASESNKKSLEDEIQRLRQQLDSDNNNKEKSEENDKVRQELEEQIKTLKDEAEASQSRFSTEKETMQKLFDTEKRQFEQQLSELKSQLEQSKNGHQQEQTDLKTLLSQEQSLRQESESQANKLQEELNELKKNMQELENKYNEHSNNSRANELKMKDTIEEQLTKIKELESKVKKESLTSDDYTSEVEQEKQKLEESLLQLKKQLNESESSVLNLKTQLEEKIKSTDLEHQKLTHQLKALKLEHEQDKQTLVSSHTLDKEKIENEKSQLTDQIQLLQQKMIELSHTNGELSNTLDTISKNVAHNEAAMVQRHNEQVSQLKRQIEEYVTLKEEQTKAVGVISAEYQNCKDNLIASNTKIASLEQTIKLLEEEHAKQVAEPKEDVTSNKAVSELEQAIKALQDERSIEHIQFMQTKEERDKLEKELEDLKQDQLLKQSEIEQLKRNEEQLKETQTTEMGAKDGHISHLKKLLTVAQKQINDLKALVVEKKNQVAQMTEEMEGVNKQNEEYKAIVNSIEENETRTKNIVAKYEQKIKQLESKIESVQHELNETNQEFNTYKLRAHTAIKQRETEQPKVNDQEDLIQELRKQLASQKKKIEELNSVNEEIYKYQQNAETLSQELVDIEKKNKELSFKLERAIEEVKNKEQFWKNKVEKLNMENQEAFDRQAELHKEVEEESAQRLQEMNNLLKTSRERHTNSIELKDAEIAKLKETNQKLQMEINHNKKRTLTITLPNANKTPALDTIINVANTSPTLAHKDVSTPITASTSSSSSETLYTPRREGGLPARGSEENLFYFTQMQAQRDEELAKLKIQVKDLTAALRDMEETENLHREQERVLKGEIRELERAKKREGVNVDYVKAVVLNFLTSTEQQQSLLPVLSNLLQFSPEEFTKVKEKYNEGFLDNVSKYWYGSPRKP